MRQQNAANRMTPNRGCVSAIIYFLAVILPAGIYGQISETALKSYQARPQVSATISQRSRSVTAGCDIHVLVSNLTDKDLRLKSVRIIMPSEFVAARASTVKLETTDLDVLLKPGQEKLSSYTIPAESTSVFRSLMNNQLVTFIPAEYDTRIVVTYQFPPDPETDHIEIAKIKLEPPLIALMWGGAIGAMLLALFRFANRWHNDPVSRSRKAFYENLGLGLAGCVTAVIALFLLFRLQGLQLPISVTVTDFFGGIIVGLFSFKLGDFIFEKLFGQPKGDAQTKVK
jgi:hypothetical protein